jgi:hypothetical protein
MVAAVAGSITETCRACFVGVRKRREFDMEGIGMMAAIGGFLLAAVLLYAFIKNKQRSRNDVRRTEEATKDLYARVDREDKVSDPDPKSF